ncbi:MAG: 1-acyl-sn-glycerol-3-phosphate acyltransferase [Phycisphaerae bacterium]|nr:1-acyl-sn-glycerol-3-phosphate acyltransferase [Phycisphaerae bacterium]
MAHMRPYYRFMRFLSQAALATYFHGRVFGLRNVPLTGGVLLASNHQSFFDPLSVTCVLQRECNYMARDTLFGNPLFKRLIESVNAFPVRRGAGDIGAVKEILRRLKAGRLVVVFPEGTRTRDGSIGKINPNSMGIARKAGAAIVPAVVDGAFEAWPRSSLLPRPWTTYVSYARPITPQQVRDWPNEQIAQVVADRMQAALDASRIKRRRARGGA